MDSLDDFLYMSKFIGIILGLLMVISGASLEYFQIMEKAPTEIKATLLIYPGILLIIISVAIAFYQRLAE